MNAIQVLTLSKSGFGGRIVSSDITVKKNNNREPVPPNYYEVEHEQLRARYGNNTAADTPGESAKKYLQWQRRCLGIFVFIFAFVLAYTIPSIILINRGGDFDTDYHKYRDLPATACLGGTNITDIWYSPPYPFNTTPTYTPARATYQTYGYLANGSLVPVLGQIPNKLERMGYVDIPCGYCDDKSNWVCSKSCHCTCQYRLGDLQIAIAKLQSVSNFTCVIDNTNTIFSLVPSADKLNYMYRSQRAGIITIAVGTTIVVSAIILVLWKECTY